MDYVVHRLLQEVTDRVRQEPDPEARAAAADLVMAALPAELADIREAACAELAALGWTQEMVAGSLGVSRKILRKRVRAWSERTGERVPRMWRQDAGLLDGAVEF